MNFNGQKFEEKETSGRNPGEEIPSYDLNAVASRDLERLNRNSSHDPQRIRSLLQRLCDSKTTLRNGINRTNNPRIARIEKVSESRILLKTQNLDQTGKTQLFLNFEIDGSRFFFAADPVDGIDGDSFWIAIPRAIYSVERRDLDRRPASSSDRRRHFVELVHPHGGTASAVVVDSSRHGMGLQLPVADFNRLSAHFSVRFVVGPRAGELASAEIRHVVDARENGWVRIGISLSEVAPHTLIQVERRAKIIDRGPIRLVRDGAAFVGAAIRGTPDRFDTWRSRKTDDPNAVPLVEYPNNRGERITAIIDRWENSEGATAVVIPPAWGRTKETLLPLAATIVETFRRAGKPVAVIRFDGTNRRGESHIDSECRKIGDEYLHFRFSQATHDILSTIDFLQAASGLRPRKIVLATFSLAAIEGRHALAVDKGRRIHGWVSAVGMVDLQSALRTISGGIDYAYGLAKGIRFGRHELVGVVADMDLTGLDAIEHDMVFLEDARREMAGIDVPVTWIHGRDDAWMDLSRVRDVLSCGRIHNRKLIEVPTGHQLRTSREALSTFQLIAEEIGEIALGYPLTAALPSLSNLARRNAAERERRSRKHVDLRGFWADYLLGRDRKFGMQLLTATAAYRMLMEKQIEALALRSNFRIADLGAGTGEFSLFLANQLGRPENIEIDEFDYVPEALRRGAMRHMAASRLNGITVRRVTANLELSESEFLPMRDEHYDAVLASLLISYIQDPGLLLREAFRVLKPGGRIVVSTLRPDADISRLFVKGIAELKSGNFSKEFAGGSNEALEMMARNFLNDASRILDFEEEGMFRFWDAEEFSALAADSGFVGIATDVALGEPPQAVLVTACRPDSRM